MLLDPRIFAFSILFFVFVSKVAATNTTSSPILIPAPPGPYVPALKIRVMVDTSRPDPYNSSEKYRRLLTSVFTPVPKPKCAKLCDAQYMPPATAAYEDKEFGITEPLFQRFNLSGICCGAAIHDTHRPPLLIWSPGFRESRLEWSVLAQYVASYGDEVVTVDHPGDATITEFPDGEIVRGVFGSNATAHQRDFALNVETQDVLFIIDSYSKGTGGAGRTYGSHRKLGVIAHGAIAAKAMLNDSLNGHPGRIAGGVNLDGVFNGPVLTDGIGPGEKSFLLWVPPFGPNNVTSWDMWWNITAELDQGNWRKELSIASSTQGTFTDFPLLADISGFRKSDPKAVDAVLGTISGVRSTSILTTYMTAFFDMILRGEKEPLMCGPSKAYPEVSFVRSSTEAGACCE